MARHELDDEIKEFLDGVQGVVEATSFEGLCHWQQITDGGKNSDLWKQRPSGMMVTAGHLAGMPVTITLTIAVVKDKKLLFIDTPSQVVDHRLVDKWLGDCLPDTAFRKFPRRELHRTNSMNFHNIFHNAG